MAATLGGARRGAGRPRGARSKRSVGDLAKLVGDADPRLLPLLTGPFSGDGLALLQWVYRNDTLPAIMRIDCAKAAAPFERPRLATSTVTVRRPGDMTDDELVAAAADAEAAAERIALELRPGLPAGIGAATD